MHSIHINNGIEYCSYTLLYFYYQSSLSMLRFSYLIGSSWFCRQGHSFFIENTLEVIVQYLHSLAVFCTFEEFIPVYIQYCESHLKVKKKLHQSII